MPATQRGHARRLPSGKRQLRYYDAEGERKTGGVFASKSAALDHYRDTIVPGGSRDRSSDPETFAELVDVYLERHGRIRRPRRSARCGIACGARSTPTATSR